MAALDLMDEGRAYLEARVLAGDQNAREVLINRQGGTASWFLCFYNAISGL